MQFDNKNIISSSIEQITPSLLYGDGFELSDQNIIPSFDFSSSFEPGINTVEFYVYDENYNVVNSNYAFNNWGINDNINTDNTTLTSTNQLTLNPIQDVYDAGYQSNCVYAVYNFINLELNSAYNKLFYVSEISSDRSELRLKSNFISNQELEQSYNILKSTLNNAEYFDEFYITFGENEYHICVNCDLDVSEEQYSILIKLYDALPSQYSLKDTLYIATKVAESQAYKINFVIDDTVLDNFDYIQGPNTNLKLSNFINNSTDLKSKKDLITSPSTASEFQLQAVLNRKGVFLQPDYSYDNFGEFVNFSSAYSRVKNFAQKVNTILSYQSDIKTLSGVTGDQLTIPKSIVGGTKDIVITLQEGDIKNDGSIIPLLGGSQAQNYGNLVGSITQNSTDATNGSYINISPANSGQGSGAFLSIVVSGNTVTQAYATVGGSGYAAVIPGETLNSQSIASLDNKVENIIKNFDGYEYFLYYNTSSLSYPKIGINSSSYSYPYDLYPTNSVSASEWLGSTENTSSVYGGVYLSASFFDESNPNWLYYTVPEFIRDNPDNDNYLDFVNMTGQHFDELWLYTKALSERYNTTNQLDQGIPLQLADDAIAALGYDGFGNNYNDQDNFIGLTGEDNGVYVPPTGSELITNYIAINKGEIINYWQDDYSWDDYVESIESPGWPYPIDRVSKEIFKRLFHNMSYLVKKKGTIAGLRELINIWGIPSTIVRINEFGGKNKDNSYDFDLWYKRYSYAYKPIANQNVASSSIVVPWTKLQSNVIDQSNNFDQWGCPNGLAFRFKTTGYPSSSQVGEFYSQSLAVKIHDAGELETGGVLNAPYSGLADFSINLNYTGSTSGSYSGSSDSDYRLWGELTFAISSSIGTGSDSGHEVVESDPIYLPYFDKGWWSVILQRTYYNPENGHTRPKQDYGNPSFQIQFSNTTGYGVGSPNTMESIKLEDDQGNVAWICATTVASGLTNGDLIAGSTNQYVWLSDMASRTTKHDNFAAAVNAASAGSGGPLKMQAYSNPTVVILLLQNQTATQPPIVLSSNVLNIVTLMASSNGSTITSPTNFAFNSTMGDAKFYYTLAAANKIYDGFDGNTVGFTGSTVLAISASTGGNNYQMPAWDFGWNESGSASGLYIGGLQNGTHIGNPAAVSGSKTFTVPGKIFSGSLQELRYYRFGLGTEASPFTLDEARFHDFTMNPESIEGTEITGSHSSFGMVNFRAPLGNELEHFFTSSVSTSYVEPLTSVHPAVAPEAAFLTTGSFVSGSSGTSTNNTSSVYNVIYYGNNSKRTFSETNVETYMLDQPAMGVRNRITNKIQLDDGEVYGNVLMRETSIQQDYQISRSYTEDINRIEVAFSPQDNVDDDIIQTYGFGVVSDAIADPRNLYLGLDAPDYYPALRQTAEIYFEKYKQGNPYDYIRLIKYFDNSLFKAIKNYVPARSSITTGVVIKPHLLERNRVVPATINPRTQLAVTPETGSTPHGVVSPSQSWNSPIDYKNIAISQSIPNESFLYNPNPNNPNPVPRVILPQIVNITGSTGGSLNVFNEVPYFLDYGGNYQDTLPDNVYHALQFGSGYRTISGSSFSNFGSMWFNNVTSTGTSNPSWELLTNVNSGSVKARVRLDLYRQSDDDVDFVDVRWSSSQDDFTTTYQDISFTPTNEMSPPDNGNLFLNQMTASFITSEAVEVGQISNFKIFVKQFAGMTIGVKPRLFFYEEGYVNRTDSDFAQAYPFTQSTVAGDVKSIAINSHEFYDGEFSGSATPATTQSLFKNCYLQFGGAIYSYNIYFTSGSYSDGTVLQEGFSNPGAGTITAFAGVDQVGFQQIAKLQPYRNVGM